MMNIWEPVGQLLFIFMMLAPRCCSYVPEPHWARHCANTTKKKSLKLPVKKNPMQFQRECTPTLRYYISVLNSYNPMVILDTGTQKKK